jgi:TRAP-type C4-dicarboxylate transport system permease small subunit
MINRFFQVLTKIEGIFASALVAILTVFVILDVGAREIFRTGIPWAQKGAVYAASALFSKFKENHAKLFNELGTSYKSE